MKYINMIRNTRKIRKEYDEISQNYIGNIKRFDRIDN